MSIKAHASIISTPFDEHGGPDGQGKELIDFSVNSNPFGPPKALLEHLKNIDVSTYPDPSAKKARVLAAAHHGVTHDQVVFGNGTAELIHRIAAAYLGVGDKVAVFTPSFGEYARASRVYGAEVISLAIDSYKDWAASLSDVKLVWLCHPNNPTGQVWSFSDLQDLANVCEAQDSLLIIDVAYLDLADIKDKRLPSNCLQLHSLTKSFTVAGVRSGYAVADLHITRALNKAAAPWQASSHAQAVAEWSFLKGAEFLTKSIPKLTNLRKGFQNDIQKQGYLVKDTKTNYFLVKVNNASQFKTNAEQAGFRVRDCSSFGLPDHIRLATQLPETNQLFVDWLSNA